MKRLAIMRHAKSDWNSASQTDHDRPLNARGKREAVDVANQLLHLNWIPDCVLSSDAKRTTETWQLCSGVFAQRGYQIPVIFIPSFYLAGLEEIQKNICVPQHNIHHNILVLGHNSGWEYAAQALCQRPISMTTSNVILLEHLANSWNDAIHSREWKFIAHITPT
jgi:phosphohistidine phosphatase